MVILPTFTHISDSEGNWKFLKFAKPLIGKAIDRLKKEGNFVEIRDLKQDPIAKQKQIVNEVISLALQPLYNETRGIGSREYFGR